MEGIFILFQKFCGHSSVTVTENEYLDLTDIDLAEMYQKYSPMMNLKKRINIPNNFEEEYTKWKLEQQTAKTTMEHCCLKKTTFYALVKEFEKIKI